MSSDPLRSAVSSQGFEDVEYQIRAAAERRPCGARPCDEEFPALPSRWCSGCLIAAWLKRLALAAASASPLSRLMELATFEASAKHHQWKTGIGWDVADNHVAPMKTCPHHDCVLVRTLPASASPHPEIDVQLLAWAVSNCHMLARRELNRLQPYVTPDTLAIERWEHVQRICEKAGARSPSVLRASLPTEITEGSESHIEDGV